MTEITRRDFQVPAADGMGVGIREVKAVDGPANTRAPMILMHGTRIPAISEYDLPVEPNGSLAANLARLGHVTFLVDARGFGQSERPEAMSRPPLESEPLVRSFEICRDIDAAVDELRRTTGWDRVGYLGWGVGGTIGLMYAALWPEKISHVVTYCSPYGGGSDPRHLGQYADPDRPGRFNAARYGGYNFNEVKWLEGRWNIGIPIEDHDAWRDPAMLAAHEQAMIDGDPVTLTRDPPAYRSPNGMLEDSVYMGFGHKMIHASFVTCKVMVIRPEYDFMCRPEDVAALREDLVHAEEVRVLEMKNTTHYVLLDRPERGYDKLFAELTDFLR